MQSAMYFLNLEHVPCNNKRRVKMERPSTFSKQPASLLSFERVYYRLISILSPASQSQYNFILCLKLHGGEMRKMKKNRQGRVRGSHVHRPQYFHYMEMKESRPGTGEKI